jgi:DNA-directed RNA polymerase specialized sigma24 family protein
MGASLRLQVNARDPVAELTLVEAFRELGPLAEAGPGDDEAQVREVNARRSAAAERIHRKLRHLARGMRFDWAILEEAAQLALLGLVARGPQGIREGAPDTEARVTGYLRKGLRNNAIGLLRPRRPVDPIDDDTPDPAPQLDSAASDVLARLLLDNAERQLLDEIVPALMVSMDEAQALRFAESFARLCDLAAGRSDREEILQEEIRSGPRRKGSTAVGKPGRKPRGERDAAQDRLDQRFKRTLDATRDAIVAFALEHDLDKTRVKALEQVLEALERRPGGKA